MNLTILAKMAILAKSEQVVYRDPGGPLVGPRRPWRPPLFLLNAHLSTKKGRLITHLNAPSLGLKRA